MPSNDKEQSYLSQDITSSWFSTEIDYTVPGDDRQKQSEFEMRGNHKQDVIGKIGKKL